MIVGSKCTEKIGDIQYNTTHETIITITITAELGQLTGNATIFFIVN